MKVKIKNHIILLFLTIVALGSCQNKDSKSIVNQDFNSNGFAQNFTIQKNNNYTLLTVKDAFEGSTDSFQYVLYHREKPDIPNANFVKLPIKRAVCMSTTHVAMLQALGLDSTIVAVASFLYDEKLQAKVKKGIIKDLGDGTNLNYELLVDLEPDVVFTFGVSDAKSYFKIKSLGLVPVIVSEFRDESPLARAEWLKFFAPFFGVEEKAATQFQEIVENYQNIQQIAATSPTQPTVFTGIPFQGNWYVPGGRSFEAQFIHDANGNYLWKHKTESMSLTLGFEVVFEKAQNAQKWLNVGYVFSKKEVAERDQRFTQFDAFQSGEMYNYTKRVSPSGGFDIYESAVVRPDLVLKDIVKTLHPTLLPDHDFYYYLKMD